MKGFINIESSAGAAEHVGSSGRTELSERTAAGAGSLDALHLTVEEVAALRVAAAKLEGISPATAAETFCNVAQGAADDATGLERLELALSGAVAMGTETGTFVLAGLPVDDAPETPSDNLAHVGETTELARCQAVVNHLTGGQMVAYEAEGAGRLYQDMVPSRSLASTQTSLSSKTELEVHTEQAFSDLRPDLLSLAALRGDAEARTYTMSARVLMECLTVRERELVRRPQWTTGVDESFRVGGHHFVHGDVRGPMSIIAGSDDDPTMVFDQDLMRGVTVEAERMVAKITDIYRAERVEHVLEPGQLLLVDNHRAIHGRSPFRPRFDGRDRFIIRTFVVRSLQPSVGARAAGSRTIQARFS